ncbi:hypothetical protein O6U13_07075 [Sphingomonas faeni]|uniref:hypothetical protein n=2 Tax=Sphingomonadaceae TaxID=41297 RepID=UPI0020BDADAB|nr:hypothetical protein [Sphingomonas faeni]
MDKRARLDTVAQDVARVGLSRMILLVAVMLQAAAAAATPAEALGNDKTIVVVGQRLTSTERALAECIARNCPPKEEIDASLAHAENQFLAGDYVASRRTLLKARSRNQKYAKDLPVDVADLIRANGRLASLNGQTNSSRINAIDSLDVLKSGLGKSDPRVLMQRLIVGDNFAKERRIYAAVEVYGKVAKQAADAGLKEVEGLALLRTAVLYGALASVEPAYDYQARKAIRRIQDTTDADLAPFREAVVTLERHLQAGNKAHDVEKTELAKTPLAQRTDKAVLVYAPAVTLPERSKSGSGVVLMTGDPEPQWIDVAFMVRPDGTVQDVDVVRQSDNVRGRWIEAVEAALAKRLYRPLAMAADRPGLRRIERYSLIYDVVSAKASNIRVRSNVPRIEATDLTVDKPSG